MEPQDRQRAVHRYQQLSIVCGVGLMILTLLALVVHTLPLVFWLLVIIVTLADSHFTAKYIEARRRVRGAASAGDAAR